MVEGRKEETGSAPEKKYQWEHVISGCAFTTPAFREPEAPAREKEEEE